MKPEIKVDLMSGETVVTHSGVAYKSRSEAVILYNQGYPYTQTNTNSGYIVFPHNCPGIPEHMTNILIEWGKA